MHVQIQWRFREINNPKMNAMFNAEIWSQWNLCKPEKILERAVALLRIINEIFSNVICSQRSTETCFLIFESTTIPINSTIFIAAFCLFPPCFLHFEHDPRIANFSLIKISCLIFLCCCAMFLFLARREKERERGRGKKRKKDKEKGR